MSFSFIPCAKHLIAVTVQHLSSSSEKVLRSTTDALSISETVSHFAESLNCCLLEIAVVSQKDLF